MEMVYCAASRTSGSSSPPSSSDTPIVSPSSCELRALGTKVKRVRRCGPNLRCGQCHGAKNGDVKLPLCACH